MKAEASALAVSDPRALVAIDLGAESCRVSLLRFDVAGKPHMELVHRFPNNAVQRGDGLRWDVGAILQQLHIGLEMCAVRAPEGIRSLAVDGWAVDYVRFNPSTGGTLADPFCYRDPRTVAAVTALHKRITADRMREITGIQLLPLNTVYQMAADDQSTREMPWLNLPEFVLYTLGARPVAERTNASHTQMLGLDGKWAQEILSAIDTPMESMPELVAAGTDIGQLNSRLSEWSAFSECRLIAPACHDTASAVAAIPDAADDWAYISSGTWSLVGTSLRAPVNTADAKAENFTNLAGVDGTVCFHKNVNGMWLVRQCLQRWEEQGVGQPLTIGALVQAAAEFGPHGYVLDVDDPDLLLPDNMPQRINAQLKARGLPQFDCGPAHAPELASFVFRSLAARYAEVLTSVAAITGKCLSRVYILGGGSRNTLLNRLTEEATGLQVICAGTESSTVGNFAAQLATVEHTPGLRPTARWAAMLAAVTVH